MNARANPPLPGIAGPEFSTAGLLAALDPHAGKALVFSYDGRDVLSGYHVTEVKAGRFASLDCGANPEAWAETSSSSGTCRGSPAGRRCRSTPSAARPRAG